MAGGSGADSVFSRFMRALAGARVCAVRAHLRRLVISTSLGIVTAVFTSEYLQTQTQTWARFEPMRILHFPYVVFLLFSGGMLGKYLLRDDPCAGLLFLFHSRSECFTVRGWSFLRAITSNGRPLARNEWVKAFEWVRENNAAGPHFLLSIPYMHRPGQDYYGFRAYAERSTLADNEKDTSAVAVFPELAWQWNLEVTDRENWEQFTLTDFERLRKKYGVAWVIVEQPASRDCLAPTPIAP